LWLCLCKDKLDFIVELHFVIEQCMFPSLIGGDFNLVLNESEESSGNINHQLTYLFNDWMNKWALIDLPILHPRLITKRI
jgi:hypothetical protein